MCVVWDIVWRGLGVFDEFGVVGVIVRLLFLDKVIYCYCYFGVGV